MKVKQLIPTCFLLALTACTTKHSGVYDVTDYGAKADTLTLATEGIQRAIDDCAENGGGIVLVPAGDYKVGSITLRSNINFHLSAGATLYASRNPQDYRLTETGATDQQQAETILTATRATHVSITGQGTLHGQAVRETYQREEASLQPADSVTGREVSNAVRYGADYRTKFRKVPPCPGAINLKECTDVIIRDIRVVESSFWSVHLQGCERVTVNGIYIYSDPHNGVNADGLDIDGCSHVAVSDCRIDTGDDAICLKTTRTQGKATPCRAISISNCLLTSSSAALKIGTESHADFEDIVVSHCIIDRANRGLNIILRDGGNVRNVLFSDLVINTVRKETFWWGNGDPLWFTIQKRGNATPGIIENVTVDNVIAHGQSGIRMEGFSNRMKNIRLHDVQLFMEPEDAVDKRARNAFLFDGIDGLSLRDCRVEWNQDHPEPTWESAYCFRRVSGLTLTRVEGKSAPGSHYPAIRQETGN